MIKSDKTLHSVNAPSSTVCTPFNNVILIRDEHLTKDFEFTVFTEPGIFIVINLVLLQKAYLPMLVTVLGML